MPYRQYYNESETIISDIEKLETLIDSPSPGGDISTIIPPPETCTIPPRFYRMVPIALELIQTFEEKIAEMIEKYQKKADCYAKIANKFVDRSRKIVIWQTILSSSEVASLIEIGLTKSTDPTISFIGIIIGGIIAVILVALSAIKTNMKTDENATETTAASYYYENLANRIWQESLKDAQTAKQRREIRESILKIIKEAGFPPKIQIIC